MCEAPLIDECITLIKKRPYKTTLKKISEATETSESWLNRLQTGKIKNPSYKKLIRIREFLQQQ